MAILVSIVFGILTFVLITNLAARKHQLDLLDSASNDLHQLYVMLLDDPSIQKDTISYAKKCFQASAKLSKGTITCGPRGQFKKTVPYNLAKLDVSVEEYIKKDNAFSKVTVDEFNKGEQNAWSSIEFVHTDTSIKCFVNYVSGGQFNGLYTWM